MILLVMQTMINMQFAFYLSKQTLSKIIVYVVKLKGNCNIILKQ